MVYRVIWSAFGCYMCDNNNNNNNNSRPDSRAMVGVQGLSVVVASGVSAIVTMPLNTTKMRLQVLDAEENGRRSKLTFGQTMRNLVKEWENGKNDVREKGKGGVRRGEVEEDEKGSKVTLSGLFNVIDGIWSACGGRKDNDFHNQFCGSYEC
ncbi:hypothetical protein PIB30_075387 [Stylosanthes scabra]|uniref:Uncharacterized protein n=1 Tax=Stylosanthes scabra TaxID=79078 RepID=A0ABU6VRT4_9FABA|nr:hypothetical protein [Stylosanthes scabra]